MSLASSIFELTEMRKHIDDALPGLMQQLRRGDEDREGTLQGLCMHLIEHVCVTWHVRDMSEEERQGLTDEQFARLSSCIPNLSGDFVVLDGADFRSRSAGASAKE